VKKNHETAYGVEGDEDKVSPRALHLFFTPLATQSCIIVPFSPLIISCEGEPRQMQFALPEGIWSSLSSSFFLFFKAAFLLVQTFLV